MLHARYAVLSLTLLTSATTIQSSVMAAKERNSGGPMRSAWRVSESKTYLVVVVSEVLLVVVAAMVVATVVAMVLVVLVVVDGWVSEWVVRGLIKK